jgi:hypothetical protein
MLIPFLRPGARLRPPADDRAGRLRRVLDRASVEALEDAPLCYPPEQVARIPLQRLRFPLAMPPLIAVFESGFAPDGALREFSPRQVGQLASCAPEALVIPLQLALTLADQQLRRQLDLPHLTTAIVVLTNLGEAPLSDYHRDILWRAFGVPAFEQLRGWDGAVIARECEVHDGLHIDEDAAIFEVFNGELVATALTPGDPPLIRARTGFSAEIAREHCECGAETPRLRGLAVLAKLRMAAAS